MLSHQYPRAPYSFSSSLTITNPYLTAAMVNLFNTPIAKFRNFFGSGPSERNAPGDQSVDKPSQPPLNQQADIPKDKRLEYDNNLSVPQDDLLECDNDHAVPKDGTAEHDDYSINTILPSYGEATETLENAAGHDTSHSSCYCDHYSLHLPNRDVLDQPNASHSIHRDLSPEALLPLTITPIHDKICYHLSFNHLNSIRQRCLPETSQALIPELCCHDRFISKRYTTYDSLSEIYFDKGTFLQRQQMQCCINLNKYSSSRQQEYFIGCPHQSLTISVPIIMFNEDILEARAWVTNNPPRCASHPSKRWKSSEGPYAQMTVCTICHSDAECTLQLKDAYLTIRYTCYRDLGIGTSPRDYKWLALLTGEGSPHRREGEVSLYARVWKAALDLKRNRLYEVTHQTPNGLFNMGTEKSR